MTHVPLKHDPEQSDGSWWGSAAGFVSIRCPLCGRSAILRDAPSQPLRSDGTRGHDVAPDGTVSPSVVCPYAPCAWHVFVRLEGWSTSS